MSDSDSNQDQNNSDQDQNNSSQDQELISDPQVLQYLLSLLSRYGRGLFQSDDGSTIEILPTASDDDNSSSDDDIDEILLRFKGQLVVDSNHKKSSSPSSVQDKEKLKHSLFCSHSQSLIHSLTNRQLNPKISKESDRHPYASCFLPVENACGDLVDSFNAQVFCGKHSYDGKWFMSASQDRCIRLHSTESWLLQRQIQCRDVGWAVLDTDLSADQSHLIYSSWSDCVHLVDVNDPDGKHVGLNFRPATSRFCLFSIQFSSDSSRIIGGAPMGRIYLYDLDSNQRTLAFNAHTEDVNSVAFAVGNSKILFSGGDDAMVKLWDTRLLRSSNPQPVGVLVGHFDGITYVNPKDDARYVISNSKDQTIKNWDLRKLKNYNFSSNTTSTASSSGASSSGATNFSDVQVPRIRWDYRYGSRMMGKNQQKLFSGKFKHVDDNSLMTYRGHSVFKTLVRAYFSPQFTTGQRYILSGSADGYIFIYDVETGEIVRKVGRHSSVVRAVSWHPEDSQIVSTSWDGTIRQFNARDRGGRNLVVEQENNDDDDDDWQDSDSDDY